MAALPVLFQRCLLFMLAHGAPMLLVLVFLPKILLATGQSPAVCEIVAPYRLGLMAALPTEVLNRCCPANHHKQLLHGSGELQVVGRLWLS